jgi:hypothetical protein
VVLDGSSLLGADGPFRIEAVREAVAGRLRRASRFRQLLSLWVDAANFDLDNQIAEFPLPAPATTLSSAHG